MLANDFYNILNKNQIGNDWEYHIILNESHRIFEGHFPEQPIVPGVCTLQIIRKCAEDILGEKMMMPNISTCKFLSVVNPLENNELKIRISLNGNSDSKDYTLKAEGTHKGIDFIKIKATLKNSDN